MDINSVILSWRFVSIFAVMSCLFKCPFYLTAIVFFRDRLSHCYLILEGSFGFQKSLRYIIVLAIYLPVDISPFKILDFVPAYLTLLKRPTQATDLSD